MRSSSNSFSSRRPKFPKGRIRIDPRVSAVILEQQLDQVSFEPSTVEHEMHPTRISLSVSQPAYAQIHTLVDTVAEEDAALVTHLHKEVAPNTASAKRVSVRVAPHTPSEYQLALDSTVTPVAYDMHDTLGESVRNWVAPYQEPPSYEDLVEAANHLHVAYIDPRWFGEQFTPSDYAVAHAAQFGLLSRLLLAFSRFEANAVRLSDGRSAPMPQPIVLEPEVGFVPADVSVAALASAPAASVASGPSLWERCKQLFRRVREQEQEAILETKEAWGVPIVVPRIAISRVMVGLFGLLIVISVPAGAVSLSQSFGGSVQTVRAQSESALVGLKQASFDEASSRFRAADTALQGVNSVVLALAQVIPSTQSAYTSARALLSAGTAVSDAGSILREGVTRVLSEPVLHADERLFSLRGTLSTITPLLDQASSDIERVDPSVLPADKRTAFEQAKTLMTQGRAALQDVRGIVDWMIPVVGHDRPRTYLLVFQNHTELRPSGGFMGSFAEVEVDRGEITHIRVPGGGPYDMKSQLQARVVPPAPLQLVSSRWEFQDVNWFGDFPSTARTVNWFWSHSGQPTLDGIVAVNATILPKLLRVTGPIEMMEYSKTVTEDNVLLETQKSVELEYDKTQNTPKKFVADLFQRVLERLKHLPNEGALALADVFAESLSTKDVQVYLADADEQAFATQMGWTGTWKQTAGDALALVEANIAGQKTSASIDEQVEHHADIQDDGSIVDTVTLTRTHNAQKGELFKGVNNVTYARVYVPRGSELLEASGFMPPDRSLFDTSLPTDEVRPDLTGVTGSTSTVSGADVFTEASSTVFGGWMQLMPGASSTTTFKYRLPFTVFDLSRATAQDAANRSVRGVYTLLLTSQSGVPTRTMRSSVSYPASLQPSWSQGIDMAPETHTANLTPAPWNHDRAYGILFDQP